MTHLIFDLCDVRYPSEAPELQIRKMADLCFLVQHYELAYNCYHTAKKDFLSDQAMLYAAGSLVRSVTLAAWLLFLLTLLLWVIRFILSELCTQL